LTLDISRWARLAALYAVAILLKEHGFVLPGLILSAEIFLVAERRLRRVVIGDEQCRVVPRREQIVEKQGREQHVTIQDHESLIKQSSCQP